MMGEAIEDLLRLYECPSYFHDVVASVHYIRQEIQKKVQSWNKSFTHSCLYFTLFYFHFVSKYAINALKIGEKDMKKKIDK